MRSVARSTRAGQRRHERAARTASLLLAVLLSMSVALPNRTDAQATEGGEAAQPAQQPAPPALTVPTDAQIATLIISTLIALNHANYTGNYGVLREIASPGFQAANNSGRLSEIFAELRNRRFDFSPIILMQPKLLQRPTIDPNGRLRITGHFETTPERLNFDLLYERAGGRWRLFGIAANTSPSPAAAAAVEKREPRP